MIEGSCLCGGVRFEIREENAGTGFIICHCNRCRKHSGAAFSAGFRVEQRDFKLVSGRELVSIYKAPIRVSPPAMEKWFCSRCGSPVPIEESGGVLVPAGTLDHDPKLRPEVHTFVEHRAPWFDITDALPQFTEPSWVYSRIVAWDQGGNDATVGFEYFLAHYPESEQAPQARRRLAELRDGGPSD